jgi:hypothetical protein
VRVSLTSVKTRHPLSPPQPPRTLSRAGTKLRHARSGPRPVDPAPPPAVASRASGGNMTQLVVALLALALLAAPLAVDAQQTGRIYRVGFLASGVPLSTLTGPEANPAARATSRRRGRPPEDDAHARPTHGSAAAAASDSREAGAPPAGTPPLFTARSVASARSRGRAGGLGPHPLNTSPP